MQHLCPPSGRPQLAWLPCPPSSSRTPCNLASTRGSRRHVTHAPHRPSHGHGTCSLPARPPASSAHAAAAAAASPSTSPPEPSQPFWHGLLSWWTIQSPQTASEGDAAHASSNLKPLLVKIWSLCSPDKWLLVCATAFMVAAALAELAIPHFATTSIFAAGAAGATSASFRHHLKLLGVLVVTFGLSAALRGYCFSILNNRMTLRLRSQLFRTLVESDTAFFDANEVGSLTSRLQTDCQAITRCVATNLNIALRNALQAFGGFIYLWVLSRELCTATLAITSILWGVTLVYGNFARRTQKVYQDVLACGNKVADEVLSLSRIVRTFSTEGQEERRYNGWLGWLYQVALRQATGYSLFIVTSHIACYASKVVALMLGCSMVLQGTLTPEQLTNFIFYVEFVVYSSLNVCDEYTEFMEAVGASERVMKLLESKPAAQIAAGRKLPSFSGYVALKDVVFRYPSRPNSAALDGVSLAVEPGTRVALVGRSGSGKSSVVALLQRLYDPCGGSVQLDGVDLREVDADWFRSHIGIVSQDTRLFGSSVAANIAYGFSEQKLPGEPDPADPASSSDCENSYQAAAPGSAAASDGAGSHGPSSSTGGTHQGLGDAAGSSSSSSSSNSSSSNHGSSNGSSDNDLSGAWFEPPDGFAMEASKIPVTASQEQIEEAAREANAHEFITQLPQGYHTPVNDKLLSGGQRQRIALARALIRKPNILILDEATSALDAESEAQVQVALDKAMRVQGRAVVVIAHRLSTVRNADRIYVLDKGKVAEVGDHQSLMAARGLYWQLVVRQEYPYGADAHHDKTAVGTDSAASIGAGPSDNGDHPVPTAAAAAAALAAAAQRGSAATDGALALGGAAAGIHAQQRPMSLTVAHGSTTSMELDVEEENVLIDADSTMPETLEPGAPEGRADNGTENACGLGIGASLDSEDLSAALGANNMQ